MIVLQLNACPSGLRGDVSKWLMEIATDVYVGQLSQRVREALWERVCKHAGSGSAIMVCTARNEQGFIYHVHNSDWTPVDFDGVTLMRRPLPARKDVKAKPPVSTDAMGTCAKGTASVAPEPEPTGSDRLSQTEPAKAASASVSGQAADRSAKPSKKSKGRVEASGQARRGRRAWQSLPYTPWPEDEPFPSDFTVLDLETTGLEPERDQIIEVACVRVRNGTVVDEMQCLVQCDTPIPGPVQNLTGLTDEILVREGIPLSQAIDRLLTFLGNDWIVGHYTAFDIRFLLAACALLGREPPQMRAIDTVPLSRQVLSDAVSNYRLETVSRHLGLAEKQAHRALPDALLTAVLYLKLNEIFASVN